MGDTKDIFHAKMGTIKDRNSKDLKEAEINKRWQEYTELYKKDLNDPDNHDGVIIHLKPDILSAKSSGLTIKASGGDRIPAELFQILKDDAVKVLHSICKWEGNRQEGQGSPNGRNSLHVSDIFISLKRQEETN